MAPLGDVLHRPGSAAGAPHRVPAGVEIEFYEVNHATAVAVLIDTLGGQQVAQARATGTARVRDGAGRRWTVSIDAGSVEVASPVLPRPADVAALLQVAAALRGAGASVDANVGLHVHRDGDAFDAAAVVRLMQLVARVQAPLVEQLYIEPERQRHACRPLPAQLVADAAALSPPTEASLVALYAAARVGRARMVNFDNRLGGHQAHAGLRTIEFRMFNATLCPQAIAGCLALTDALCDAALGGDALAPLPAWNVDALARLCERTPAARDSGMGAQLRAAPPELAGLRAPGPAALPQLLALVGHPWWEARVAAAQQLARHGLPELPPLQQLAADEDRRVAYYAQSARRWRQHDDLLSSLARKAGSRQAAGDLLAAAGLTIGRVAQRGGMSHAAL